MGGLNMEQIITLKVDLEYPEEAKFAIDAAVKTYSDFKREQATRRFVENGCTPEDAEKIAKFIQFLDQCFSEHNERALRKASEVDGN